MKLLIGISTNRDWSAKAVRCLNSLSRHLKNSGIDYTTIIHQHSCLSHSRQFLLDSAVADFTHLLFIDDDSYYKKEIIDTMLRRDLDIVACNFSRKQEDALPTAVGLDGKCLSSKGKTGVEEIRKIGFGFTLIKTGFLKNIPAPHFEVRWAANKNSYMSEDYYFCQKLKENGIKIFIDHEASQHVGHIGEKVYIE